ncbi:MAG: hypothetical protein NXI31_00875 [bacterium]|nr:hypothetical protein [bacterium]
MRYHITILLGAFLLFQVQPQLARVILPWFGGGPAVWSACLLFFQTQLLAGYAYAHYLHCRLAPWSQAVVHIALLVTSLLFLPVAPGAQWKPTGTESPTLHILLLLFATVGLPYMLLAATGPLLQGWFTREHRGRSPYRLYSLSNVGSLAALLSFPFLFEPNLTISVQANVWSVAYVVFLGSCVWCAWSFARTTARTDAGSVPGRRTRPIRDVGSHGAAPAAVPGLAAFATAPGFTAGLDLTVAASVRAEIAGLFGAVPPSGPTTRREPARCADARVGSEATVGHRQLRRWVALAALPSVMLLAVTNVICVDIAVTPFFWVMPLAIYLLTFVLTFDSDRWYRPVAMGVALTTLAVMLLFCAEASWFVGSVVLQVVALCATLFLCGMVCHGELVRQKPAPERLTAFYLAVALGGAVGGVIVAVIAPVCFDTFLELDIGLGLCAVVGLFTAARSSVDPEKMTRLLGRRVLPFAFGVAFAGAIVIRASQNFDCIERSRNFFGRAMVQEVVGREYQGGQDVVQVTRRLRHGSTLHGEQIRGGRVAAGMGHTYFGEESGVAYALRNHPAAGQRPLHVGIIGLGTGTLAYYAHERDHYTFYEIDPVIVRISEQYFTYLADARLRGAFTSVKLGDARVQMDRELATGRRHGFDVLIVDAFSSDSIPVHLLTREANRIYWRQLAPDGILLTHLSNRFLDLLPVARGLATDAHKQLRVVTVQSKETNTKIGSAWAIMTDNREFLAGARMQLAAREDSLEPHRELLWTDDFSSLWHVMR